MADSVPVVQLQPMRSVGMVPAAKAVWPAPVPGTKTIVPPPALAVVVTVIWPFVEVIDTLVTLLVAVGAV